MALQDIEEVGKLVHFPSVVELIGVPFDLCGAHEGSRLGPEALRLAGIADTLRDQGLKVTDLGDLSRYRAETSLGGLSNARPLAASTRALKSAVEVTFNNAAVPIVLGGDHTVAIGGVAAALNAFRGEVALLWIDAHADLNTPATSPSGNMHGMPIAALWGLASGLEGLQDQQWSDILSLIGPERLLPKRTSWLGIRELDPGEALRIYQESDCLPLAIDVVDRLGLSACVNRFDDWMRANGATQLWVSFDVDSMDPVLAPGTGTAVRGGLTYREAHLLAELLYEKLQAPDCPYRLCGVDLVEVNPVRDTNNMTAMVTVEWLSSLFGKTILGR